MKNLITSVLKPKNVRVIIRDYDVEANDALTKKDSNGCEYREVVFE